MRLDMIIFRLWLYRGLVAVTAGLMITAAIMPWWTAEIYHEFLGNPAMQLYQYGIPRVPVQEVIEEVTPLYQIVLAWIYIAAGVGLILWSTWLKGRKGQLLLGGIGFINIAYAAIAIIWISNQVGEYGVLLQGVTHVAVEWPEPADIYTDVRLGYYLAHVAGLMCIVLALLRNRITKQA